MEIVVCTDNNYIMPTAVMIKSLCNNSSFESSTIHVISNVTLTDKSKTDLENCIQEGWSIKYYYFDIDSVDKLSDVRILLPHLTIAAFLKFFIHRILPCTIDKALYLDGDTLVLNSLKELWETNITNVALGAVTDAGSNCEYIKNAILYDYSLGYFNSGVMLINLNYWRQHNVEYSFLNYSTSYPDSMVCADQDVFNYVFSNSKYLLDIKYNVQYVHYWKNYPGIDDEDKVIEALKQPVIVHFTGETKPWLKFCDNPNARVWRNYLRKTPFKNKKLKSRPILFRKKIKYLINVSLGLNFRNNIVNLSQ